MRILFLFFVLIGFAACDKNGGTEEENITTIELNISGTGFTQKVRWLDSDGDDVANSIDTIVLPANVQNLTCSIKVLDETESPAIDLTEEIKEESNEHLFTYLASGANLTVVYDDQDGSGLSFGLKTKWSAGAASTGKLTVKLYHEPTDKSNIISPGGEVDFSVDFPVRIQ